MRAKSYKMEQIGNISRGPAAGLVQSFGTPEHDSYSRYINKSSREAAASPCPRAIDNQQQLVDAAAGRTNPDSSADRLYMVIGSQKATEDYGHIVVPTKTQFPTPKPVNPSSCVY